MFCYVMPSFYQFWTETFYNDNSLINSLIIIMNNLFALLTVTVTILAFMEDLILLIFVFAFRCITDILCLLLFVAFVIGMVGVGIYGGFHIIDIIIII
jgi:hypothetical protein